MKLQQQISYKKRLKPLQLPTPRYHRFKGDMTEVYKSSQAAMTLTQTCKSLKSMITPLTAMNDR